MIIDERIFSKLTDQQKKAVEAAQSPEELLAVAKETGYELSPEQLTAVQGDWCGDHCSSYCPGFYAEDSAGKEHNRVGTCFDLCLMDRS